MTLANMPSIFSNVSRDLPTLTTYGGLFVISFRRPRGKATSAYLYRRLSGSGDRRISLLLKKASKLELLDVHARKTKQG